MSKTSFLAALIAATLSLGPASAFAQAAAEGQPTTPETPAEKPAEEQLGEIDKKIKGYEKLESFLTFYTKTEAGKQEYFAELTEDQLDDLYFLQITAGSGTAGAPGGAFQGGPIADIVFTFKKTPTDRLVVVQPNTGYRATGSAMERVVERSFPPAFLDSFRIEAKQDGRYLIDMSAFFKSDIAQVGSRVAGYGLDGNTSWVEEFDALPENLWVLTQLNFARRGGQGPASVPMKISHNLMRLPETDYVPRLADTRIGYFTVDFQDVSDNTNPDQTVSYIQRWDLRKKDPSAKVSDPVKPIEWWISNDVPEEYRQAVREGLEMWNPVFEERAGIRNAIVVKQMPEDADWHIADVRKNIIRWTTGLPFAIALFRANPLTGEILNAAINMDGVFAGGGASRYDIVVDPAEYFDHSKHEDHAGHDPRFCNFAREASANHEFAKMSLEMLGVFDSGVDREEFIQSYVRSVVSHEMGHCLGLRHNYISSTQLTAEQLADGEFTSKYGVSNSVMEYTPFNIFAIKSEGADFYAPVVGTYDKWAIEYGYMPVPGADSPQEELPKLREFALNSNIPEHRFETDQMGNQYDPFIATFDLAANPLDWVERTMRTTRYLAFELGKRYPEPGEPFWQFTRRFNSLTQQYFSASGYATRFIGGVRVNNNFAGAPGAEMPVTPVDAEHQRRALSLMNTYIFAENAFAFPKEYFSMLQPNPAVSGSIPNASSRAYPVFSQFAGVQGGALRSIFDPSAQTRIVNNEFRTLGSTFTLAELYDSVAASVWSELRTGNEITMLRRQLQRDHLNLMIETALGNVDGTPADGVTLAWDELNALRTQIANAINTAPGPYGRPHLAESLMKIDKAFAAQRVQG